MARGRDARTEAPRSSHGRFEPPPDRPDPVTLLEEQGASRVHDLLPIRYGRMLVSPFTFYRGAALIQATDLSATPTSGVTVQLCGDAHLSNFGLFGTPERQLLFDINDFDETLPGPWEWDVKRLAASFEILGRHRGFSHSDRRTVVMEGVWAYRERMREAAESGTLRGLVRPSRGRPPPRRDAHGGRPGHTQQEGTPGRRAGCGQSGTRDSMRVFTRRVGKVGDRLRIVADPPVTVPVEDLVEPGSEWAQSEVLIKKLSASYRETLGIEHHPLEEFRYVHAARKIVGVGSVGTRCYILLLVGRDETDPLVLQVKEAQASVLEPFAGTSEYPHHGQRVVAGQRLMQGASDAFLGWQRIKGLDGGERDYYVRQLHDWKGAPEVEEMLVPGATVYARLCGATLARAHARWGDRVAIVSYLGKGDVFDRAIAGFSVAYADQNERDYEALVRAVRSGRLTAETGV